MQNLRVINPFSLPPSRAQYRRLLNSAGVFICVGGLGAAYYTQYILEMEPCPLCIFQRLALLVVGLAFLAATLHNPSGWGAKAYGLIIGFTATIGIVIATRHLWLQQLPPDQAPRCGPGLDYLLLTFPLSEVIREVFTGSGECATVDRVLGLSIPAWTLLLFLGLGLVGAVGNWRLPK